jgi:hypothetical protein
VEGHRPVVSCGQPQLACGTGHPAHGSRQGSPVAWVWRVGARRARSWGGAGAGRRVAGFSCAGACLWRHRACCAAAGERKRGARVRRSGAAPCPAALAKVACRVRERATAQTASHG